MRSHPPTLFTLAERTLKEECAVKAGDSLLLAVSGGPDSMALLHVCAELQPRLDVRVEACGVDHGLRAEAAAELDLAEALARRLGVPFARRSVSLHPGGNLQARARDARYEALEQVRSERGLEFLLTAHHKDDRAETVLIRLLRGAQPEGLAVLPARSGKLLRPFVRATRSDVLSHIQRHELVCAEDPSNNNPRFLRSRVRGELLPLMKQLSPGIVEHLSSLADELMEGTLGVIEDETGRPILLKRSQRQQLRRALRYHQYGTRVLLSEGRVLTLEHEGGQPRVVVRRETVVPPDNTTQDKPKK